MKETLIRKPAKEKFRLCLKKNKPKDTPALSLTTLNFASNFYRN